MDRSCSACLYKFLTDLLDIQADVRKLKPPDIFKLLGRKYNPFGGPRQIPGLVLQKICPELGVKKKSKYAAVLRYVAAEKPSGKKVRDFVRENGGISRPVSKKKKLRQKAPRRKASKR